MPDEITAAIESSIVDLPDLEPAAPETPAQTDESPAAPEQTADAAAAAPADPTKAPQMPAPEEKPRRRYPIPLDRHEAALAKARSEGEEAANKVRAEYEGRVRELQQRAELLDVADKDPERFFQALVQADPRYAALVQKAREANGNGNGHAPEPTNDEPAPDATFPDGSTGYSPQQFSRYMAWHAQQVEERISKRYKDIEDAYQVDRATQGALQRVQGQVQEAMQWKGFSEHSDEIAAALKANRRLTLEGAYRQVVMPTLEKSREQLRAELIAEMNAKPKKVTGTTPTGGAVPSASSDDLESVIKAAIANHPDR